MKKTYSVALWMSLWLLLCTVQSSQAQVKKVDYSIYYTFKYITDTVEEVYSSPEEYLLYKVNHTSRFMHRFAHHNDSIHAAFNKKMGAKINTQESLDLFMATEQSKLKRYKSDLRLMKNFKSQTAIILLYNTWKRHYMEEPLSLQWEMRTETQNIAGLDCYKATTTYGGRKYIAWFSPEIPISDGPYIFNGLPGLILKVEDEQAWYTFEIKSMNLEATKRYVDIDFLAEKFLVQVNRAAYIERSKTEKENPKLIIGLPDPTGERLIALKKRREKRFDLLLEQ